MYKIWSRKYIFICGIVILATTGIIFLTPHYKSYKSYEDPKDLLNDDRVPPFFDEEKTFEILDKNLEKCLHLKDETNSFGEAAEERSFFETERKVADNDVNENATYYALVLFNKLLSSINLKAAILEPSMLYCMLQPTYRDLLKSRKFHISKFEGSKNIVTFGVFGRDAFPLQKEEIIFKFEETGFRPHFVQMPLADWMKSTGMPLGIESYTSHVFYFHQKCTIHLVVLVERNHFLWHSELRSRGRIVPPPTRLLFASHDAAYEKFAFVSLVNKTRSSAEFYIPSSPHYFLLQMLSSRFIECDLSRAVNLTSGKAPSTHPNLSVGSFNRRAVLALREIKAIFHPLLMNVWVTAGTLLGWYRQCDIIPYTTDVDLAAWAFEVQNLDDIIQSLRNRAHLNIVMRMGLLEEALEFQLDCHNLRVDIFYTYPIHNGSWYSIHSPSEGFYSRCYYPHFSLCSAELLGEKVQVPCETEHIILSEYGRDWSKPISEWGYISSVKNRGPFIYWDKSKFKQVYQNY